MIEQAPNELNIFDGAKSLVAQLVDLFLCFQKRHIEFKSPNPVITIKL